MLRALACACLLGIFAALSCPAPASAHAIIVASTPAVDAVLRGGPIAVKLRFNSRIDHRRSRLQLIRADAMTTDVPLRDTSDPDTLSAELEALAPGRYRLRWQVLAVDGHITRGDIPFEVAP